MPWSVLFAIGLLQGLFLLLVFATRSNGNLLASRLLMGLLGFFVLSNWDDLLLATGWYKVLPWFFAYSFSAVFAYGPLFYLYILAVSQADFRWKSQYWLHFLPAGLNFLLNLPFLLLNTGQKTPLIDALLTGQMSVNPFSTIQSLMQIVHFGIYLYLALRAIQGLGASGQNENWQVPFSRRAKWLHSFWRLFALIWVALVVLLIWHISLGRYTMPVNYVFTLITSAILYFMAYRLMLNPELPTPGFSKKYQSIQLGLEEEQRVLEGLKVLLEKEKVFTDPELKLGTLAKQLSVQPQRLSRLINETYGQSFSDFINQQRVEAFVECLNDPQYSHYTLHGLALEVGFNSKSAFNAAFKKITGKTPSEFKSA